MAERVIEINSEADVIIARKAGRIVAQDLGFGLADQTRLSTAISELTRNVVEYAGRGTCRIVSYKLANKIRVEVYIVDHGPGIPDIEQALRDGYSSKNSLGAGLPGSKRLVNEFEIISSPGHTQIKISIEKKIHE